MNDNAQLGVE